jgi:acyl transferase domain-containing protein/aryl carrier-like protein
LPTYPFAPVRHWLPRTSTSAAKQNSANDVVIAFPVWRALTSNQDAPRGLKRLVVLCSGGSVTPRQIEERLKGSLCVAIESREASFAARFTAVSRRLFEIVQDALRHKIPRLAPSERLLVQVVISDRPENACFSALAGLLKSAHQENPLFLGQVVWLSPETKLEQVEKTLSDLATTPNESVIRHRSGEREVQRWMDASAQAPVEVMPWKSGGVYLITGGMGGLGRLFAAEILERASSAHVVLVGRSPLEGAQLEALAQLRAKGSVVYEQVDVCNPLDVRSMIERITQRHGSLQAVIHSAGVHRDNYVLNKTIAELESVLAPKVTGTWNLDDATRHLDLDFFILFSSGTGVAGNAGQSDYAMANAFMDEYASYRNAQVAKGSGHGLSLSFDWSLWADGGMKLDVSSAAHLREQLGIKPLETSSALRAFYAGLALCQAQVMMVGGEASKIRERVFGGLLLEGDASRASKSAEDGGALLSKVRAALKSAVVELIKVPESALGLDDRLDDFGLDSMMVTRLNQRLRDGLGDLPKTLFYEHRTLESIAEYLTSAHQDACLRWVGSRLSKAYAIPQDQPPAPETLPTVAGPTPVAVIGMSGRYPGARNLAELWERLKQGESCITEIPASRWSLERFYHSNVDEAVELGKSYGKWGGFLEDHAAFDPLFFNISAKDAAMISPQERLFLETCWHALEDGGYCPSKWSDAERERVGVYGAVTKTQANTSFAALVNRVSFAMDLRGPSMPVDTKCSSALVALHHACEALARRDIDVAIVGAVNLYLEPETYIELAKMHLLCTSATPAVFSAGGRGFVPSEGVGALVLKRLPDAQRSRDGILAVVRGTAVNHNGRTLSFGAPSAEQQTAVIQRAVSVAQIDPRSISYIESAANGSEMSDAIEIRALNNAFAPSLSDRAEPPRIGSLKSALGHAEAASGMAQLTKVILQLQHRTLCGTLVAPDATDVDVGSFQLQRASSNWESANTPRRAGVHSTGASGVNAHAIVEEYEPEHIEEESVAAHPVVFAISAKTESALRRYLESWRQYLAAHSESNLARLAYSAQRGREAMKYRFACVADSVATLLEQLESAHPQGVRGVAVKLQSRAEGYQNLADVARRWVEGEEIEWERLYPHSVPRMMHGLPTYPFSRKPYGLRSGEPVKAEEEAPADVTSIQRTLRGLINKLLAFEADDEIDATGNFAEMGFDSISIVKFVEAVSETFEVRLEVTAPFNYPSINTLAEHIGALRKKASPGLDMESLLMGLAQDDLQVDDALELLERQTWDAVSP